MLMSWYLSGYHTGYFKVCILDFVFLIQFYYTTLLKSAQITHQTSTNIQQYSDSWLFVHFQLDKFIFIANQIASAHKYFMYANWVVDISKFLYKIPFSKAVVQ